MRTVFRNPQSTWLKLALLLSLLVVLVLVGQQRVTAVALEIADVAAPDINCFFDLDCTITVSDFSDAITLPGAAGSGFLQSRMLPPAKPVPSARASTPTNIASTSAT
jgi:hypothetical protein